LRSSPVLRFAVHTTFASLWLLGAAVFVLKHFFAMAGEFGPSPHPWQPPLLLVHGVIAVAATFLFGWICGDHVALTWRMRADRASGVWLLVLVAVLILTGFAAFFLVDDSWRSANGTMHELLGLALMVPWLQHLMFGRARQ
jgi:NO-binding membrane sensor protein with MHYT domain